MAFDSKVTLNSYYIKWLELQVLFEECLFWWNTVFATLKAILPCSLKSRPFGFSSSIPAHWCMTAWNQFCSSTYLWINHNTMLQSKLPKCAVIGWSISRTKKKSLCSKWSWLEMFASSIWNINYTQAEKKGVPLHAIVFFDWFAWLFSPYQGQYTQVIAFITKVYMTKIDFKQLYTVRPRDTRPQAARTLQVHVFESGPQIFELNEFM